MAFCFNEYSRTELEQCGEEFQKAVSTFCCNCTGDWTRCVTEWFRDTHASGVSVYSRCTGYEYLVDLCHIVFPSEPKSDWHARWLEALRLKQGQMRLALESEWGKYGDSRTSLALILDDAMKIALLRADVKVMIFASQQGKDYDSIMSNLRQLREATYDNQPWLCIDVPWGVTDQRGVVQTTVIP